MAVQTLVAFSGHVIFPGTFSHVFFCHERKLRKSVNHVLWRNGSILYYLFIYVCCFIILISCYPYFYLFYIFLLWLCFPIFRLFICFLFLTIFLYLHLFYMGIYNFMISRNNLMISRYNLMLSRYISWFLGTVLWYNLVLWYNCTEYSLKSNEKPSNWTEIQYLVYPESI